MDKSADLKFPNGSTPMTVADIIIRDCSDKEWLEDVIFYIEAYLSRAYGCEEGYYSKIMKELKS